MDHYGLKLVKMNAEESREGRFIKQLPDIRVKMTDEFGRTFNLNKSTSDKKFNSSRDSSREINTSKDPSKPADTKINDVKFNFQSYQQRRSSNYQKVVTGLSPIKDQQAQSSNLNNSFSPSILKQQIQKNRKVSKKRQPIHQIYSEKLDLEQNDAQIQKLFQNISNNLNNLLKYINNKKTVYKLLSRLLDNYNSIKPLLINVEIAELLEPYTVYELNKRKHEKSYNIYQSLIEQVKSQSTNHDSRLSTYFLHNLCQVSEKITDLYQQKVEEKMVIMSDNIIKEWGAVQLLQGKLISKGNQPYILKLKSNFNHVYNYDTLPILLEGEKLEYLESLHGQLPYISKQQRRYNKKIYEVLAKVRSHNNKNNFNLNITS